jgi:hypothetical protein
MNLFTIIVGIIWIISFVFWFKDLFPEYTIYILYTGFIAIGLCLWLIISFFTKSVTVKIYWFRSNHLFVYLFYWFIWFIIILLLFLQPDKLFEILWSIAFFVIISLRILLWLLRDDSPTISERKYLADKYEKEENYSEAIWQYNKILAAISSDDERIDSVKSKISELKKKHL